jgi:mono/diheme cytochrome c family protein
MCYREKEKVEWLSSAGLIKQPADHISPPVQQQTDGAIFWKISEGNTPMPGYKKGLSETQIWQLVNYIRTLSKARK